MIKDNSPYVQLQCDAIWRDLFRLAFLRVKKNSLKYQLLFAKYYLSYGMYAFSVQEGTKVIEQIINIANAKVYAFLHELAHITAEDNIEYYVSRLKDIFSDELIQHVYDCVTEEKNFMDPEDKLSLRKSIDEMRTELYAGDYTRFREIIADMRALHSMCSCFIINWSDGPEFFLNFKAGIVLERSFKFRIRSLYAHLNELSRAWDISEYYENISNSQYMREFIIRDRISELTEQFILADCFGGTGGKEFLLSYFQKVVYSREAAEAIDESIRNHLEKINSRMREENTYSFLDNLSDVADIMDYLLYYPAESRDQSFINRPTSIFGWTGLIYDSFTLDEAEIEKRMREWAEKNNAFS